jgi:hypothetical protein
MRRRAFVVAVVLVAALTAVAPAASAQNVSGSLDVGSKHTTFGTSGGEPAPTSLTNVSVKASGEDAFVAPTDSVFGPQNPSTGGPFSSSYGLKIVPTQNLNSISATLYDEATGIDTVAIYESGGNQLDSASASGGGDSVTLSASLTAGNSYYLMAEGTDFTRVADSESYPVSANSFDVTSGADGVGSDTPSSWWMFESVSTTSDSGTYQSAAHTVGDAETAFVNLTLQNSDATITVEENSSGTWSQVAQTTVSTSANHTVDISSATGDELRTTVEFSATSGTTVAELHDEGILFDAAAPSIDSASASPTGDLQQASQTLSLNVSDADFGTPQGDSLNVTFETKAPNESSFSTAGSETLTANGTANTSLTADVGGTWEWRATATDSYGESVTSQTFTFSAPGRLEIRNETTPQNLINVSGSATATVTFFGSETVVERPINNGTVDLTGLPADEEFVAAIDADGYYSRRIVIPSIYQQETAYLLPENATAANIVFKLDDSTGNFDPEETTLFIEKAITRNNSTEYRVVAADEFGASGEFAVDLLDDTRYRLRVMNAQGDQRVLGSYTTSGDALATVPIGDVAIGDDYDGGAAVQTNLVESGDYQYVKVTYVDSANATDSLELGVELENGTVVRPNTTETVSGDVYSETINVSQYPDDTTYRVYYSADRSGETLSGTDTLNGVSAPLAGVPLDPQVASIGSWVGILAVGGLIGIASGPFGALAMVVTATFFTILGTVGIPSLLLTIAGAVAILARIGDR